MSVFKFREGVGSCMSEESRTSIPCSVATRDEHAEFRGDETWDEYLQRIVPGEELQPPETDGDMEAVMAELNEQRELLEKLVDVLPQIMENVQASSGEGVSMNEIREAVRMEMREVLSDY